MDRQHCNRPNNSGRDKIALTLEKEGRTMAEARSTVFEELYGKELMASAEYKRRMLFLEEQVTSLKRTIESIENQRVEDTILWVQSHVQMAQ